MTATEQAITTHDELSIEPQAIIPPDSIQPAPAESWRRGREFQVFKVPSRSFGVDWEVVYNEKLRVIYCTCPAGQHGRVCAHVRSTLWKMAYDAAFRLYADLSLPELAERQRDFIEMERGALVQVRAFRALNAAIGDLVWERTQGVA